jgi:gamma-glutamylcyclotransferase (GGCT)/AIG2-like uncharacterized protein YtfP
VKSKMNEERLPFFVYGTLLPGQPNAVLWGESIVAQETAVLKGGRLYDMGFFPMLVEEAETVVTGMVNHIAESEYAAVMARLDALEGYDPQNPDAFGYQRVVREVQLSNGRSLKAWVYVGQKTAVRDLSPIPGGNWAAYSAKTFQDIEQFWRDVEAVHHRSET